MKRRHIYLAFCVLGIVVPYSLFLPWLADHGLNFPLFLSELFASRISAFFACDVIASAAVLCFFIFSEGRPGRVRHLWLPLVATVAVGVSLGLPLFLYLRQLHLDESDLSVP